MTHARSLVLAACATLGAAALTTIARAEDAPAAPPAPPVEVTGFVDAYYGYNFNKVDPGLRTFDLQHNTFSLSVAEVAFAKAVTTTSRVGFRIDLDFGPTADATAAFEPSSSGQEVYKHIQQGYVSVLAGSKLQIDFGKFVTPHGAEVIESRDNWNYTRSILFGYAIPFYHVGARASLPVSDKFTLSGYLVNGWNSSSENNGGKTVGIGGTLKPTDKVTWVATVMTGPEQEGNDDDYRTLFDTTLTLGVTPKLTLMGNFDYGMDTIDGSDVAWFGLAAYAKYQAKDTWALVGRYEWLSDDDAFMTGTSQKLQSFTLTSDHKLAGDLVARLEYRVDISDTEFFTKSDSSTTKNQSTVTLGLVYGFGGKI